MYNYDIKYNRLLIFDGSYALHRALSVPEYWNMSTNTGIKTGGILGVLKTIQKELNLYNYFPVVVFDGGLSKRRLDIFPNYKRNLEKQQLLECKQEDKTEQQILDEEFMREYRTQRNLLIKILPCLGIPTIRINDWEGDDLLYIISKMCLNSIIVSDDKDLIQLIKESEENNKRICRIKRAVNDQFWDMNTLRENNVNVRNFISCKAIIGDPSDNLQSACFQVGEKTAQGLLELYTHTVNENIPFPTNEEELTQLCKKYNINKRKAYLYFNEDQFLSNLLMTDLNLVDEDITKDVINNIEEQITFNEDEDTLHQVNNYLINYLQIKSFDSNKLYNKVKSLRNMININDINSTLNVVEINKVYNGTLF